MRASTATTAGILAMVFTGSSVGVLSATVGLPPFAVQSARYAVAAVVVAVFVVWRARRAGRQVPRPTAREFGWILAGAGAGLIVFNLVMLLGVRHAEPAVLGSAVACVPLVLAVAAPLAARRRPSGRLVLGAVVVSGGAVLVTGWGRTDLVGMLCGVVLVGCEALFTLCAARGVPRLGAFIYTAWMCAVAAVVFAVLSVFVEHPDPHWVVAGLAPVLYLGVAVTAVAFVLWFAAVNRLGPAQAGLCAGVAAPASAVTGWVLGEPAPSVLVWVGMGLVAVGIAIGFGRLHPATATVNAGASAGPVNGW